MDHPFARHSGLREHLNLLSCHNFCGESATSFGSSIHATSPNGMVQFGYIKIVSSWTDRKYIFMLRNDHLDQQRFYAFAHRVAETFSSAILNWYVAFGVPKMLTSKGTPQFKDYAIRIVCKKLGVPHHSTLPYSPWSNGPPQCLEKELLCVLRSICSKMKLLPRKINCYTALGTECSNQIPDFSTC